jgi:membrane-associated phospholipid phosphatase
VLAELRALQARRTVETSATVDYWDDPAVVLPWTNLGLDLIKAHRLNPVRAGRALALLHVAMFDTLLATTDARLHSDRPAPAVADSSITVLGQRPSDNGSFPSDHAAVAAAAATVLTYLFPEASARELATLADDAAMSRLWAGHAVRSDVEAGQAIGYAVGQRAVARGMGDNSNAGWDGSRPAIQPGAWSPTPPNFVATPVEPLAGTWRPWVLPSGDAYRPGPPPAFRSAGWRAELAAVQRAVARRTPDQEAAVHRWAGGPGTVTPGGLWIEIARDLIVRGGLAPLAAAHVLATTSVAVADGFICCWDAKYAYWMARPVSADPSLSVLIPTPPFPSYTSGHATISAAAAIVLSEIFPDHETELEEMAVTARMSRLWGGIHFAIDNEMGALGGGMIGRLVIAHVQSDQPS